jgi:hypothetical protein
VAGRENMLKFVLQCQIFRGNFLQIPARFHFKVLFQPRNILPSDVITFKKCFFEQETFEVSACLVTVRK